MPDRPETALDRALRGLGGPAQTPAGASARAWSPPLTVQGLPQAPEAHRGPIKRVIRLSQAEGEIIKVDVVPADIETYVKLGELVSKSQRKGAFCIGFYDIPALQVIAAAAGATVEPDPVVQGLIDGWNRWCLELEWIKNFSPTDDLVVPGLRDIELRPFQVRDVKFLTRLNVPFNFNDMGLGKSIETLAALLIRRHQRGGSLRTLFMAPTSMLDDWAKKFRRYGGLEIVVAGGQKPQRALAYGRKPEFLAISYDIFIRDLVDITREFQAEAMVLDEAQRLTNRQSKAVANVFDYVDITIPEFIFPLTGTPLINQPTDIWPVMRLANKVLAGPAKAFEKRYLKMKPIWKRGPDGKATIMKIDYGTDKNGKKREFTPMRPDGVQNMEELRHKIAPWVLRRLKTDVLSELPEKIFEEVSITLGKEERKAYEELQAQFAEAMAGVQDDDVESSSTTFLTWFTRAQQICSSLQLVQLGDRSSKIEELSELVKGYAPEHKILIFSRFREMTSIVCRELADYSPLQLHGGIAQSDRQPLVDAFQEKPEHRLFVSTLKAGGVGLTLTAADIVIRLDRWMAPSANDQAVDRAHRIGQTRGVIVIDLIVKDSVEERILEILERKKKMISSLVSEEQIVRRFRKSELLRLI